MPRVKNISGGPLDVPILGRMVDDGEIIDGPDFQDDGVSPLVWPDNRWKPVADTKKAASDKADG